MKNTNKQNILVMSIILIISTVALALSIYTLFRLQSFDNTSMRQQSQMNSQISQMRFCHDNQIIPCTDEELDKWNSTHPDDVFNRAY